MAGLVQIIDEKAKFAEYLEDSRTLERELAPFVKIPGFNERQLITMDYETGSHNGIKQINAIDWLLHNE